MLYALGQHQALRSVQSDLDAGESLFAFHDDICTVSQPEGSCRHPHSVAGRIVATQSDPNPQRQDKNVEPWRFEPPGHAALLEAARVADLEAKLWLGDLADRAEERGTCVLWVRMISSGCNSSRLLIPTVVAAPHSGCAGLAVRVAPPPLLCSFPRGLLSSCLSPFGDRALCSQA